ncbi:TolC family protein [Brevundimonas pishanensis]|uniref:TolC family protein n=1 Tax=Brevundimonas pishanensis TaxID=2896315 RepID=UPI001FA81467|nr:TolC family protein [Brevundimonas pishanensis]
MKNKRLLAILAMSVSVAAISNAVLAQEVAEPVAITVSPAPSEDLVGLREAVASAIGTHPALRQSASLIDQRLAEERIVRSDGRPVIEYSLQPGYNPQSDRDAILQLNISGRVPVYDFGKIKARRSAAANRTVQYRHLFENQEELIALDLVNAYLQYALWRDALAAANEHIEQLGGIRQRIEMRIAAGLADVSDLRRTDVSISRANLQRDQVRSQMEQAEDRIHLMSSTEGQPVGTFDETAAMLRASQTPSVDSADDVPVVAAARSEWDATRDEVRGARANRYPSVSIGVTNSSYLMDDRRPGQDSSMFDNRTQFGLFLTGRVALGGGARHQIAAAEAASSAAASRYQSELLRLDMAVVALTRQRAEATNRLGGSGEVVSVLENARDLYWQEYILSKRRLTEVFDIEREIYQSRVDQLQARADQLSAVAELLGVQGQLISTLEIPSRGGGGR